MCDVDNEPCEAWDETLHTARKPHICQCCGGAIVKGDRYTRVFFVSDGRAYSEKECGACSAMIAAFVTSHGSRVNPSTMSHVLSDCIDEEGDDSEAGRKWTAAMEAMQARQDARRKAAA